MESDRNEGGNKNTEIERIQMLHAGLYLVISNGFHISGWLFRQRLNCQKSINYNWRQLSVPIGKQINDEMTGR